MITGNQRLCYCLAQQRGLILSLHPESTNYFGCLFLAAHTEAEVMNLVCQFTYQGGVYWCHKKKNYWNGTLQVQPIIRSQTAATTYAQPIVVCSYFTAVWYTFFYILPYHPA
jgi:hypothetical protein